MKKHLFESCFLDSLLLRNRFVRSATHEGLADDSGLYTPQLTDLYARLAADEAGLIITGHTFVSPEGKASPKQAAASDDAVELWRIATELVHRNGGTIALQLAHGGGNALDWTAAIGPSPFRHPSKKGECREASAAELDAVVSAFGAAAKRAREGGFDAVQIHAAHGYLISEFLSPFYNRRTDEYGGTLENRMRLLIRVYDAVRRAVGEAFPVLIKINSGDFVDGGFTTDDCVAVCRELERRGLNGIEISGGIPEAGAKLSPVRAVNPEKAAEPVYYEAAAKRVKSAVSIPVILVGGIRWLETAERLLEEEACDFISLSRPLIAEPDLIRRWNAEDSFRSACVTCNACFRPILTGKGFYCPKRSR